MTLREFIDPDIVEFIHEQAKKFDLEVHEITQRYEDIDDVVTVVCLSLDTPPENLLKLEEAVSGLESQVIVVRKSN